MAKRRRFSKECKHEAELYAKIVSGTRKLSQDLARSKGELSGIIYPGGSHEKVLIQRNPN